MSNVLWVVFGLLLLSFGVLVVAGTCGAGMPSTDFTKPVFLSFTVSDLILGSFIAIGIILFVAYIISKSSR